MKAIKYALAFDHQSGDVAFDCGFGEYTLDLTGEFRRVRMHKEKPSAKEGYYVVKIWLETAEDDGSLVGRYELA